MKKMVCVVLALLLCLNAAALAEFVPSKTTEDLTQIVVVAEHVPEDVNVFIEPVPEEDPDYEEAVTVCQTEISKLADVPVADYFGEVKDATGNSVEISAILETEEPKVYELIPVIAGNYDESYGTVTATMYLSTPYEVSQKLVVMIGYVQFAEDGTWNVEWFAYEGKVVADDKGVGIQVELDAETMLAIQNGKTILAVVSQ